MQKELKLEENDFTGAVFEGKFYGPEEVKQLESLPSRAEVYSKLLGVIQSPAQKLVSTLQVGGCCSTVLCIGVLPGWGQFLSACFTSMLVRSWSVVQLN